MTSTEIDAKRKELDDDPEVTVQEYNLFNLGVELGIKQGEKNETKEFLEFIKSIWKEFSNDEKKTIDLPERLIEILSDKEIELRESLGVKG